MIENRIGAVETEGGYLRLMIRSWILIRDKSVVEIGNGVNG